MVQATLPIRIMRMVGVLHRRGLESLYLYSGLSPSGGHWRYAIGVAKEGAWPSAPSLVSSSLGANASLTWSADSDAHPEALADSFEAYFGDRLVSARIPNSEFVAWYSQLLTSLPEGVPLVFFADFDAPHQPLLATAPGYTGRL